MRIAAAPMMPVHGSVPPDLADLLKELESWADGNRRDARAGTIAFWLLKAPAILTASSAGVFAQYQMPTVSLVVGFVSGACVLVDSFNPRGALRNTHMSAFHDIRNLTNSMMNQWRSRDAKVGDVAAARKIIAASEPERNRIAQYVRDAESSLSGAK